MKSETSYIKYILVENDSIHCTELEVLTGVDKDSKHRIDCGADVSEATAAIIRIPSTLEQSSPTLFSSRHCVKS